MRAFHLAAIAGLLGCSSVALCFISSDSQLPSLTELTKIAFITQNNAPLSFNPYAEVLSAKEMFQAYSIQAPALSQYRDPVLTRSAAGEALFKNCSPAVVAVIVGAFDKDDNFNPEGLGTGAIVDSTGYILTNWHVVDGHDGAIVFLKPVGGSDLEKAKAFGAKLIYQNETQDLALLKLVNPPTGLHSLTTVDASRIQVAEDIHIIGHPHGNFWSYSTGVVSQIRNDYTWNYSDGSKHEAKVLQLQTAINPGNSGGPVLDDSGQILGLVAMSEEGQNLDYAIAADVIKEFLLFGTHTASRAPENEISGPAPVENGIAKLPDGRAVSRAVFSKAVIYSVFDKTGAPQGIVAKFNDGIIVDAWRPDSDGHLQQWSADLPNGQHLVATAANGILSEIQ